jgi:SAM-dependent methyltransferase
MDTGPSAVAIVDLILQYISPTSVVDVGCGTGRFLEEFKERGVDTILGLDGPATEAVFRPDASNFLAVDLTAPVEQNQRFDLALCLEVAEHLPAESADCLVKTLTDLAPLVLFSAAHPDQGGQGHINEQWPTYWYRRFAQHGYVALDILRGPLGDEPGLLDCYRRNLVFFVESSHASEILDRADERNVPDAFVLSHLDGVTVDLMHQPFGVLIRILVRKLGRRVRRLKR